MDREEQERIERVRRAVLEAYGGETDRGAPTVLDSGYAGPAADVSGPPPGTSGPLRPAGEPEAGTWTARTGAESTRRVERAALLAGGMPRAVRGTGWFGKRIWRRVFGRAMRFETAWQHEFNDAALRALEAVIEDVRRLEEAAGAGIERLGEERRRVESRLDTGIAAAAERLRAHEERTSAALEQAQVEQAAAQASLAALERALAGVRTASDAASAAAAGRIERIEGSLEALRRGLSEQAQARLADLEKQAVTAEAARQESMASMERVRQEQSEARARLETALARSAAELRLGVDRLAGESSGLRRDLALLSTEIHAARESLGARLGGQAEEATRQRADLDTLTETGRRLMEEIAGLHSLAGEAERLGGVVARVEATAAQLAGEERIHFDPIAFAERFRGSQEEIRGRLERQVEILRREGSGARPVLELGCGRGELLDLCRAAGIEARGLDHDAALVASCRARGLDAFEGSIPGSLRDEPAGSAGAILAIQVIEHLPPGTIEQLMAEAHRILTPGGVIILESLNPACLSVLANTFYRDPTHRRPIHPETAAFLLEAAGFTSVRIETHTPVDAAQWIPRIPHPESAGAEGLALREEINRRLERINAMLFADQEYTVVGRRP